MRTPQLADNLRRAVLQAAIAGKLNDRTSEDARDLLAAIQTEKTAQQKTGKQKKNKPLAAIKEEEIPFAIPENWVWVRLGEVLELINGRAYKQNELLAEGKYKVLRVGNFFSNGSWYFSDLELPSEKYCDKGDLLYAWSASFGPKIWDGERIIFHYHIWNVKYGMLNRDFVYYFLMADTFNIHNDLNGTTMKHLSMENMIQRIIPLPPLTEQQQIVAKLNQLLTEIDELKAQEQALLATQNAFPKKLRAAILQAAMQGELNERTNENARDLLAAIQAEKAALQKTGKLKKDKPLAAIKEEEIPFAIPENWVWVRLGDVAEINPRNKAQDETEAGFMPMNLLNGGFQNSFAFENRSWEKIKKSFTHFSDGDVVIAKITPCFQNRKSAVISGLPNKIGAGTTELHVLRPYAAKVLPEYLLLIAKTTAFINGGVANFTGTAGQQRVSSDFIKNYPIPLPPLTEQQQIVTKLEALLAEIDTLENAA
ncbi:restriction endonuclease subunit S [Cardiobacterium sp. Marseille-Q4385]|uniref:restriction endonuclease subunit S n=1 Tax=Cardiobacterium sp. Marseille-Q4385 TaxID=2866573 RepID=UPI001CE433B6|nr:restriction endonuclease subunit S [Cardiobacterium sp. Marseille-Q4385]